MVLAWGSGCTQDTHRGKTGVEMWPFKRKAPPDATLRREIASLREDLEQLAAAHERLRGRYYATRPQPPASEPPKQPESKAEVLRAFGFVPGRPVPHK